MVDRATAWRTYFEASARLQTRLDRELRETTDLTLVDYNVLLALDEAAGHRLRMGELAEALVFSPSRLTYQVGSMVQRGLVRRETCPDDRRGMWAVVTAAGARAFAEAQNAHRANVQELFLDHLSDADLAVLDRLFGVVGSKLTGTPPARSSC